MEFLPKEIDEYAAAHTSAENELLAELNRYTWSHVMMPRMLSGHVQGRMLSTFSRMIRPNRILEIGTYTGYSALCLAEGLTENGKLITLDVNEELEETVRKFLSESPLGSKIDFRIAHGLDEIPKLEEELDLVFIDADKENYSHYYDVVWPKLRIGGWIIADNVLWSGKVLDEKELEKDAETKALAAFSKKAKEDERAFHVLFPVRDGLMVIQKLKD